MRIRDLFLAAAVLCSIQQAFATELITNGNFELFTSGNPTGWTYTQGDGPGTLQNAANSPFTNIYAAGSNDLLFTDSAASGFSPILLQTFATQSGTTIFASWDFNLASLNGNMWVVQIDDSASAAIRFDMDFTGGTFAFEQNATFTTVTSLTANTWYNVQVALNITNSTLSGTITPFGSSAVPFSGNFRITGVPTLNRFVFIDISQGTGAGQNGNIQLDNVSVNTVLVPEPSTIALSILGIGSVLIAKRFRRRAI